MLLFDDITYVQIALSEHVFKSLGSTAWTNVALSSHGSSCKEDGGPKANHSCAQAFDGKLLSSSSWISANPGVGTWINVSADA